MKIWIVGVHDCEINRIVALCSTKKIAERELFKERDRLIEGWKEIREFERKMVYSYSPYAKMIKALKGKDYKLWNNYPHECPYISFMEVIEK